MVKKKKSPHIKPYPIFLFQIMYRLEFSYLFNFKEKGLIGNSLHEDAFFKVIITHTTLVVNFTV